MMTPRANRAALTMALAFSTTFGAVAIAQEQHAKSPTEIVRETAALRAQLKALSKRYDQLLNDLDESGEPEATTPESEAVFARILEVEEELVARARELKTLARTPAARKSLVAMLNTESQSPPEQEGADRSIVLAQSLASTGDPGAYA
ncbi:MAG: hypothetical protein ACYTFT_12050, partial [Planctomycetota bacterium]